MKSGNRAVVFAYHNVGVCCLRALLAQKIDVKLVVTHHDHPTETIWFDSVCDLAMANGIPVAFPDDPNTPEFINKLAGLNADFIFSFYYRLMLAPALLVTAAHGAYNMHGSLLPKYRGRVPINWAIIKGETQTGASLHEMVTKPDAGRLVDQERVTIGPDETAREVFDNVTAAAARIVERSVPKLIAGTATFTPQDLSQGSYFGGRRPEDGVINWTEPAKNIHNLVRAVAPPYPGASTCINGENVTITKTQHMPAALTHTKPGFVNIARDKVIALCGDGTMLRIIEADINGQPHNELMIAVRYGDGVHAFTTPE